MMDPILEAFTEAVRQVAVNQPAIPYISNLSGQWMTDEDLNDPTYWARHLRGAVRFAEGAGNLLDLENPVFLEVGPGNALSTFIRQHNGCGRDMSRKIFNLVRHPREELDDSRLLLQQAGELWQLGQSLDWGRMRENEQCRRIPLPTYPFQRQRYWLDVDPGSMSLDRLGDNGMPPRRDDPADWFYIPTWQQSPVTGSPDEAADDGTLWLVLGEDDRLTDTFIDRLNGMGYPFVLVKRGAMFERKGVMEYRVNPADEDCFNGLAPELSTLPKKRLRIVHLWCQGRDERGLSGLAPLASSLEKGLHSVLSLVKALGESEVAIPVQLGVVTTGTQDVTGDESLLPWASPLLGAIKTIPLEYPNISCCCLDVAQQEPNNRQAVSLVEHILREFTAGFSMPLVAFRGRHRWGQVLKPHPLQTPETGALPLKKGGVYLVTGKGGLGWTFAAYLAEQWQARLIIVGRTELTEPRKLSQIRHWEELGAQVMVASADVADSQRMRSVIEEGRGRFGPIDGVVHTAGVADFLGIIQNRTRAMTTEVLAPKAHGALVLDALLESERLDFFLMCSSLGNSLYKLKFGQVGYQAANEFLEAFAAYRSANRHGLTITVNWIDWKEVGMTARVSGSDHDGALVDASLAPAEGVDALRRLLGCGRSRVSVSTMDWPALQAFVEREIHRDVSAQLRERPELDSEFAMPGTEVEKSLASLWQRFLGVESIGVDDDFFALGGDSLLAVQLIARINEAFSTDFPSHILIKHKTVTALARLIQPESQPGQTSITGYVDTGGDSHLVEIQEGDKTVNPLFLIHPIGGHVYFYRDLASHLPKQLPVFGLQARGMDGKTKPIESIEEMAELYLREILQVRPHGPYRLGGASFGGLVAFELARMLAEKNQDTELLFMGDTPAPGEYSKELADEAAVLAYLASFTPQGKEIRAEDIRRMTPVQRQETIVQFAQNAGQQDPDAFLEQVHILIDLHGAHARAMENYNPAPNDRAVIYFKPLDFSSHNTVEPLAKWSGYTTAGIELHQVPGNHNTMNDLPNVEVIGQILSPLLG
jgi:thioesterase domain-containing protein/NAD(P)-dependent dehydrogenase (short-subunit alcohol dehydrogenase family)/acyl carrier protein